MPNGTDLCHVAGSFLSGCQDRAEAEAGPIRTQTAHKTLVERAQPCGLLGGASRRCEFVACFLGGCSVWTRPTGGLSFGWEAVAGSGYAMAFAAKAERWQHVGSASNPYVGGINYRTFLVWHCCGLSLRGTLGTSSIRAKGIGDHRYARCHFGVCPVKRWQLRCHGFWYASSQSGFRYAGCHSRARAATCCRARTYSAKAVARAGRSCWAATSGEPCGSRAGAVEK